MSISLFHIANSSYKISSSFLLISPSLKFSVKSGNLELSLSIADFLWLPPTFFQYFQGFCLLKAFHNVDCFQQNSGTSLNHRYDSDLEEWHQYNFATLLSGDFVASFNSVDQSQRSTTYSFVQTENIADCKCGAAQREKKSCRIILIGWRPCGKFH